MTDLTSTATICRRLLPHGLLGLCSLLGLAGCSQEPAETPARATPNVLLVVVDTLRADHLHAYGYDRESTPRLDALFAEGILFENARSNAACTFPSVNSLLTSRHPSVFISRGDMPGNPEIDTERTRMRKYWQSGERPAHFGIPEDIASLPEILGDHGFTTLAVSASPIVRDKESTKKKAVNRWGGFGRGFDVFHEECLMEDAECVNRAALQLLGEDSPQPFLLYLHYMDPHGPYQPPASFQRRFGVASEDFSPDINAGNPHPLFRAFEKDGKLEISAAALRYLIDLYDDEIAYFDEKFAELLAELTRRGLLDNTLFVVVSDHGEAFDEHGSFTHCQKVYDPEIRVPMFMRLPDGPQGLRLQEPTQDLDILPTILDFVGIDYRDRGLAGRSLRPVIEGRDPESYPRYVFSAQRAYRSVNDERYKLVVDLLTAEIELFDLKADPAETVNVANDNQAEFRRLRKLLYQFLIDTEGGIGDEDSLSKAREVAKTLEALGYLQ